MSSPPETSSIRTDRRAAHKKRPRQYTPSGSDRAPHGRPKNLNPTAVTNPANSTPTPSLVPSLDTLETTVFRAHFHNLASSERAELLDRLDEYGTLKQRNLERLIYCGSKIRVFEHTETGHLALVGNYCRQKICPACARRKQFLVRDRIAAEVSTWSDARFITLTTAHTALPLSDQIARIQKAWRKLRLRRYWRTRVRCGIWCLEIKRGKDNLYHVHLHTLIDTAPTTHSLQPHTRIEHAWLKKTWLEVTGDSYIVDVRKADSKAIRYLAKYIGKGSLTSELLADPDTILETKGKRTWGTYGDTDLKPPDHPEKFSEYYWPLGNLEDLLNAAKAGDDRARDICNRLEKQLSSGP